MSAYDLVVAARKKQNLPSDNALAVLMQIDNAKVSNWKSGKSKPNGETALYLAELADLKPSEAKRMMQEGYTSLKFIFMIAFTSAVLLLGITQLPQAQAIASSTVQSNVYYVKLRKWFKRLFKISHKYRYI